MILKIKSYEKRHVDGEAYDLSNYRLVNAKIVLIPNKSVPTVIKINNLLLLSSTYSVSSIHDNV